MDLVLFFDGSAIVPETPPTDRTPFLINRRATLGLVAASAVASAAPTSLAAARARLDPANPDDARKIYRQMHYRTDSGMVFWWIRGEYLAQVGVDLTPMYGLNFGVIQRVTQRPDGGFDIRQLEMGFRTDLSTGRQLSLFHNPITGTNVPVTFSPIGPTTVHYSRDNIPQVASEFGGSTVIFQPYPTRPFLIGDQVYAIHRARTRVTTPGVQDRIFNDISTFSSPASQALDPDATWADASLQSSDITSWPRWLNMADHPGSITLRAIGGKVRQFGDMPAEWLDMLHATEPSIGADPIAAIDRPQATFKN